jgi:hypothetical protein
VGVEKRRVSGHDLNVENAGTRRFENQVVTRLLMNRNHLVALHGEECEEGGG